MHVLQDMHARAKFACKSVCEIKSEMGPYPFTFSDETNGAQYFASFDVHEQFAFHFKHLQRCIVAKKIFWGLVQLKIKNSNEQVYCPWSQMPSGCINSVS